MVFIFDISEKDTCSIELILQSLKDYFPASFKYFYKKKIIWLGWVTTIFGASAADRTGWG